MDWSLAQPKHLDVLVLAPHPSDLDWLFQALESADYTVCRTLEPELSSASASDATHLDLVVVDAGIDDLGGTIERLVRSHPDAPVVLACGEAQGHRVIEAMRSGALDVVSPERTDDVPEVVERVLLAARERRLSQLLMDQTRGALSQAREQLQIVSDRFPAVVWTAGPDGRIRSADGAALRELGIDPGSWRGRPSAELLQCTPALEHDEPAEIEFNLAGRLFQATVRPLRSEDGTRTGSMGVAVDVTDRRRLESQLLGSQRFEALGRLAGGIAHDFSNIITLVDGYASLALDELGAEHPVRDDLLAIRDAAGRAGRLVSQILAFSRREPGHSEILRLDDVVRDLEAILRRVLGEQFKLEIHCADDLPPIRADPVKLEQVVLNLVVNARDAMPTGGVLRVQVYRHEPPPSRTPRPAGSWVCLRVQDEGQGMDPATVERIFEPFFSTKGEKGTGLGLAIVHNVVRQHRGEIRVHSQVGRGTCIEVMLPSTDGGVSGETGRQTRASSPGGTETILVVEDEPALRNACHRILSARGYRVFAAPDQPSAVALAREIEGLDVVVCDIVMPESSAADIVQSLRRLHPGLRVVYISGYPTELVHQYGISPDEAQFLPKPFGAEDLLTKVRQVLGDATSRGG